MIAERLLLGVVVGAIACAYILLKRERVSLRVSISSIAIGLSLLILGMYFSNGDFLAFLDRPYLPMIFASMTLFGLFSAIFLRECGKTDGQEGRRNDA